MIGSVREYDDTIDVLYPGEQAEFMVDATRIFYADHGGTMPIRGRWRVTPMRGVRGWLLRARYRLERLFGLQPHTNG